MFVLLRFIPVLKTHFFCDVSWDGDGSIMSRIHYTVISSSFHFFLTLVVVAFLYSLIYIRLKQRYETLIYHS